MEDFTNLELPWDSRIEAISMGVRAALTLPEFIQMFIETRARGCRRAGGFRVVLVVPAGLDVSGYIREAIENAEREPWPYKIDIEVRENP